MASLFPFLVRDAGTIESDITFIISTFDSALPFLHSIGNHEQWGSIPFSQRDDFSKETLRELQHSVEYNLTGISKLNGLCIFIVEREYPEESSELHNGEDSSYLRVAADGRRFLPVGFAYIRENWVPTYVKSQPHLQIPDIELGDFIYLEVIVTDSRVRNLSRGAGAALIHGIRDYGRSRQKKASVWIAGREMKENW